jgi:hypothetical protein
MIRRRARCSRRFAGGGAAYVYDGVTQEDYDALMAAPSKGAWFNAHIRDRYPFREV